MTEESIAVTLNGREQVAFKNLQEIAAAMIFKFGDHRASEKLGEALHDLRLIASDVDFKIAVNKAGVNDAHFN